MNRHQTRPQSLTAAFWNANGLSNKKTELEEFIQRHQMDVLLIGETHLRANDRLSLRNFRVYRTDREGARGGGTAIMIKSSIDHYAGRELDLHNIEATNITVNLATAIIGPQPGAATTGSTDTGRRGHPDATLGFVASLHGPSVKQYGAYRADRRCYPTGSGSADSYGSRIGERTIRDEHHPHPRQQGIHPPGNQRLNPTEEPTSKTMAANAGSRVQGGIQRSDVDHIGRVHRRVRRILAEEDEAEPLPPASPEEIRAIIRAFRTNKAPGSEGITNTALKHAPKKFVMHMTNICNAMLRLLISNWSGNVAGGA
ncbi:hypothetical protein Trydic_g8736 [Trypoxylus dichotomus]